MPQTGDSVETHQAFCSDTCHILRLEVWRTFGRLVGDRAGKPVGAKGWMTFMPGASFCGHRAPRVLPKVALLSVVPEYLTSPRAHNGPERKKV